MSAASPVPSLSQIEAWDTGHLNAAASFWSNTAATWEGAFATVHREIARPGGTAWEGRAADAALNRASGDPTKVRGVAEQVRSAATIARLGSGTQFSALTGITDNIAVALLRQVQRKVATSTRADLLLPGCGRSVPSWTDGPTAD